MAVAVDPCLGGSADFRAKVEVSMRQVHRAGEKTVVIRIRRSPPVQVATSACCRHRLDHHGGVVSVGGVPTICVTDRIAEAGPIAPPGVTRDASVENAVRAAHTTTGSLRSSATVARPHSVVVDFRPIEDRAR
jgi:hypothetical protein